MLFVVLIAVATLVLFLYFVGPLGQIVSTTKPKVKVGTSTVGEGRGVFATSKIKAHEIIEICPTLNEDLIGASAHDYVFGSDDFGGVLALGNGSLYNHQDEEPDLNATYEVRKNETTGDVELHIWAIRDIQPGEEIFISYGENWWTDRGISPNHVRSGHS